MIASTKFSLISLSLELTGAESAKRTAEQSLGRKPQDQCKRNDIEPARAGDSCKTSHCRPFHGLRANLFSDPGARAPGFMLTPASQAKSPALLISRLLRRLRANATG